ncbi:MAG: hypothetical protein RJQ21_09075 [Rhodospirillales bacterium]
MLIRLAGEDGQRRGAGAGRLLAMFALLSWLVAGNAGLAFAHADLQGPSGLLAAAGLAEHPGHHGPDSPDEPQPSGTFHPHACDQHCFVWRAVSAQPGKQVFTARFRMRDELTAGQGFEPLFRPPRLSG